MYNGGIPGYGREVYNGGIPGYGGEVCTTGYTRVWEEERHNEARLIPVPARVRVNVVNDGSLPG